MLHLIIEAFKIPFLGLLMNCWSFDSTLFHFPSICILSVVSLAIYLSFYTIVKFLEIVIVYLLRLDWLMCFILEGCPQVIEKEVYIPHLLEGTLCIYLVSQFDLWYDSTRGLLPLWFFPLGLDDLFKYEIRALMPPIVIVLVKHLMLISISLWHWWPPSLSAHIVAIVISFWLFFFSLLAGSSFHHLSWLILIWNLLCQISRLLH